MVSTAARPVPATHRVKTSLPPKRRPHGKGLADVLGCFSIGLGLAEVIAPKALARFIGIREDHPALTRAFGLREIMAGVGILTEPRPTPWMVARVVGDALDLAVLGRAAMSDSADRPRVLGAIAAVAAVTALDVICARQLANDTH